MKKADIITKILFSVTCPRHEIAEQWKTMLF